MKFFKRKIKLALLLSLAAWAMGSRLAPDFSGDDERLTIQLRFPKAYPSQSPDENHVALRWTLSLLGAQLPRGCYSRMVRPVERDIFSVNLRLAGFPDHALPPLARVLDSLKNSEEYARMCGIDLGRFIVLTLHSPRHYYRITGAARRLEGFLRRHDFDQMAGQIVFPVARSGVANGTRVLKFFEKNDPRQFAFLAEEGRGSAELGNFVATDFEVFDVMPNGQLRFAIYDQHGELKDASPPELGAAGKVGSCMWCHESSLQILRRPTPTPPGSLSTRVLNEKLAAMQQRLADFQRSLDSEINFSDPAAHESQEVVAASFMQPSVERLAWEWGHPLQWVSRQVGRLPTGADRELPRLGERLLARREVDVFCPFGVCRVPFFLRDYSFFEPDFF